MSPDKIASVSLSDLEDALDFVSVGQEFGNEAYLNLDTGVIHYRSEEGDIDELPEGIEDSDRYARIPHKNQLGLGRKLALSFAEQHMPPADADSVFGFFRRKGAYSRFENLLDRRGLLERWYEFETQATQAALRDWCSQYDIEIVDKPSGSESG